MKRRCRKAARCAGTSLCYLYVKRFLVKRRRFVGQRGDTKRKRKRLFQGAAKSKIKCYEASRLINHLLEKQ